MSSFIANPPEQRAESRLFCLPYSGAGSARYYTWKKRMSPRIEIVPVQLPGREMRYQEEPYTRLDRLVVDLTLALPPYLDKPYAIFGYSMGGHIGFELVREIRRKGFRQPEALIVAAARAPKIEPPSPFLHQMSDAEVVRKINTTYGMIPDVILREKELLAIYVRAIKADFSLLETYTYYEEEPFDFPIIAFCGEQDTMVREKEMIGWGEHTSGTFSLSMLPGDHFFINGQEGVLLDGVKTALAR